MIMMTELTGQGQSGTGNTKAINAYCPNWSLSLPLSSTAPLRPRLLSGIEQFLVRLAAEDILVDVRI